MMTETVIVWSNSLLVVMVRMRRKHTRAMRIITSTITKMIYSTCNTSPPTAIINTINLVNQITLKQLKASQLMMMKKRPVKTMMLMYMKMMKKVCTKRKTTMVKKN